MGWYGIDLFSQVTVPLHQGLGEGLSDSPPPPHLLCWKSLSKLKLKDGKVGCMSPTCLAQDVAMATLVHNTVLLQQLVHTRLG